MLPDDYFEVRRLLEAAPSPTDQDWGRLVTAACRAIDADDWPQLRRIADEALKSGPCESWRKRLQRLLADPVFRDRAG